MYLVDTNVISAGAPTKSGSSSALIDWMERNSERLFLSVITVAEVDGGIAKARREGAVRKADRLAAWLETVLHLYGPRILPVDVTVARVLGQFIAVARGKGLTPGLADLAIAATAASRNYAVLTRNSRHFTDFDVRVANPFDNLPV